MPSSRTSRTSSPELLLLTPLLHSFLSWFEFFTLRCIYHHCPTQNHVLLRFVIVMRNSLSSFFVSSLNSILSVYLFFCFNNKRQKSNIRLEIHSGTISIYPVRKIQLGTVSFMFQFELHLCVPITLFSLLVFHVFYLELASRTDSSFFFFFF